MQSRAKSLPTRGLHSDFLDRDPDICVYKGSTGGGRWEEVQPYLYLWLIHVDIWEGGLSRLVLSESW